MKQKENALRILLAEQHRNTRHDACDIVMEVCHKFTNEGISIPNDFIIELTSKIMNLKQRIPIY